MQEPGRGKLATTSWRVQPTEKTHVYMAIDFPTLSSAK
jgi:hypothetical protein